MKYEILYDTPLVPGSTITFNIGHTAYIGKVTLAGLKYYVAIKEKFKCGKEAGGFHSRLAKEIFDYLNTDSVRYYETVLGTKFARLIWPETSLEDLEKVLAAMKSDFDVLNSKVNTSKIVQSKFRFRQGDTILFDDKPCNVVGYYFSAGFNNYNCKYGYVIDSKKGGHNGCVFGYNAYGDELTPSARCDLWYIYEEEAKEYKQKSNLLTEKIIKMEMRLNYKEAKLLSSEEKSQKDVEYAVKSTKLQYQSNQLATQQSLEEAQNELEEAKTEYPLDFAKIVSLMDKVESLEKGLKALENLGVELGLK